jgi:hypothetical protein
MGQAKRRGSFEDRKDLAIHNAIESRKLKDAEEDRRYNERMRARAEEQARVEAMPEEERAAYVAAYHARKQRRTNVAGLLAITALSMGGRF